VGYPSKYARENIGDATASHKPVKYFSDALITLALLEHNPGGGGMSKDVSPNRLYHWPLKCSKQSKGLGKEVAWVSG